MHLAITGFLEAKRIGFVPTLTMSFVFSDRRVMVEHLLYGPFSVIIKKIIMTIYTIFFTYIFIEILVDGKAKNFIYWFSWGTILFMPFMIMYMRNVDILHNGRLSPMMPGGFPIHPNNFAIRLLFTYWVNVISMQREKIKLVNICHIIYCFLCVILIFLTGSRSSLLSLGIATIILLLTAWRKYLVPVATLVIIFLMTTALTPDNPFVKRFIDYDSGHYSSGRADTWKEYYRYTSMKQLFTGVGPLATTSTIIYKYSTHHIL